MSARAALRLLRLRQSRRRGAARGDRRTHARAAFRPPQLEVLSATPRATADALRRRGDAALGLARRSARRSGAPTSCSPAAAGCCRTRRACAACSTTPAILREAIRARRKTMIFAQSIGPLDFLGRLVVRAVLQGPRPRDRARRALARAAARARSARRRSSGRPIRSFSTTSRRSAPISVGEGLGPESGPYAVVSVRKTSGFRDGAALVARAVDRLAQRHGMRSGISAARAAPPDAAASTDVIRACASSPMLLPECSLREGRVDSARRARRHRHAAARARSRRALRACRSRDRLRSEGHGALRGSAVPARAAVDAGRAAAERRRGRRARRPARSRARRALAAQSARPRRGRAGGGGAQLRRARAN